MDIIRELYSALRTIWESTSTTVEGFWGLLGLGAFTFAFIVFTLRAWRTRPFAVRALPAVQRLRAAVGRAMETGEEVHVTLGTGELGDLNTADTLAGLSVVSYLARRGAQAEIPVHVRVAEPTALAGALASLEQGARRTGYPEAYDPRQGEMVAPSPMAYGAGVAATLGREPMALNVLVGTFGPEVLLIAQAGLRRGVTQVGGTSAPAMQPLFYGTMDAPLIGEEIYALGAALDRPEHTGSLAAQDLFRAVMAVGILVATVLAVVGEVVVKRLLPPFVALLAGLIVLLDFFLDNPLLDAAASFLLEGAIVIGAFALILGLANLLFVHERHIRRRERGWPASAIILLAGLAGLLVGLLAWQRPALAWFYRYLLFPLEAGVGALLAFAVVGAAVRVWQLGTWEGSALLVVGVLVLLGTLPLDSPYFGPLGALRDWVIMVPALAAVRGILLGVALGIVATGLRVLLWVDRPYE